MGFARDYATAILHRGRIPMEPTDFTPNWGDRPRKWKHYPTAQRIPLPDSVSAATASVQGGLFGESGDGRFSLTSLSGMLLDSYGLLGRRLAIQANTDLAALPRYTTANFSRGAASGGGLYPVSIYLVSGPGGPLTPGVYYYSAPHHALQLLRAGDFCSQLRAAVDPAAAPADTDQFLVLGVKYWQNAFKYNSFCFHAVSMDVGAAIQAMRMWSRANRVALAPALWFDEPGLARLLGVSNDDEGIFAVVGLPWEQSAGSGGPPAARVVAGATRAGRDLPLAVRHADQESSRTVISFPTVRRMQAATVQDCARRPADGALAPAHALPARSPLARIPLPTPAVLDLNIREALRRRRSSFGRFQAQRPISAEQLSTTLAAAAAGQLDTDTTTAATPLAKLYVFVNHVDGIAAGSYEYDAAGNALLLQRREPPGGFLQRNYFLANYNLEQAAAVIVPTIRTQPLLLAVGDRGYRLVNATVGAIAQALYTAAAALDLGCGVALGFDNVSFIEHLALQDTEETPLLIMMIGNERTCPADFRYDIS